MAIPHKSLKSWKRQTPDRQTMFNSSSGTVDRTFARQWRILNFALNLSAIFLMQSLLSLTLHCPTSGKVNLANSQYSSTEGPDYRLVNEKSFFQIRRHTLYSMDDKLSDMLELGPPRKKEGIWAFFSSYMLLHAPCCWGSRSDLYIFSQKRSFPLEIKSVIDRDGATCRNYNHFERPTILNAPWDAQTNRQTNRQTNKRTLSNV